MAADAAGFAASTTTTMLCWCRPWPPNEVAAKAMVATTKVRFATDGLFRCGRCVVAIARDDDGFMSIFVLFPCKVFCFCFCFSCACACACAFSVWDTAVLFYAVDVTVGVTVIDTNYY